MSQFYRYKVCLKNGIAILETNDYSLARASADDNNLQLRYYYTKSIIKSIQKFRPSFKGYKVLRKITNQMSLAL